MKKPPKNYDKEDDMLRDFGKTLYNLYCLKNIIVGYERKTLSTSKSNGCLIIIRVWK